MKLIEQIIEVMAEHSGPAHVDDIANLLLKHYPNLQTPAEDLPNKISGVLSADVKKASSKSSFSKVKNKSGGYKRGIYRLKKKPVVTPTPIEAPSVTTQYTGKAGESAVISELLFYGYNASAMAVDDGIDVVASKDNKYFHIQVKTSNYSENSGFNFTIKKSSFTAKDVVETFYILVARERNEFRYHNDFLVFPSSQIRQLLGAGVIKDGQNLSLRVRKDSRGRYILNKQQDVTISVNAFNQLA